MGRGGGGGGGGWRGITSRGEVRSVRREETRIVDGDNKAKEDTKVVGRRKDRWWLGKNKKESETKKKDKFREEASDEESRWDNVR